MAKDGVVSAIDRTQVPPLIKTGLADTPVIIVQQGQGYVQVTSLHMASDTIQSVTHINYTP